jgi:hypothetical protein
MLERFDTYRTRGGDRMGLGLGPGPGLEEEDEIGSLILDGLVTSEVKTQKAPSLEVKVWSYQA